MRYESVNVGGTQQLLAWCHAEGDVAGRADAALDERPGGLAARYYRELVAIAGGSSRPGVSEAREYLAGG